MFLKQLSSGHLFEVLDVNQLTNPAQSSVTGRFDYGEEPSNPEAVAKSDLAFPSGETLPRCWTDPHYRDEEAQRHYRQDD